MSIFGRSEQPQRILQTIRVRLTSHLSDKTAQANPLLWSEPPECKITSNIMTFHFLTYLCLMRCECNLLRRSKKRSTSSAWSAMVKSTKQASRRQTVGLRSPHMQHTKLCAVSGGGFRFRSDLSVRFIVASRKSTEGQVDEHEK